MSGFDVVNDAHLIPAPPAPTGIDATLDERGSRYGAFKDMAELCQRFKATLATGSSWERLAPDQKEALEMIVHKITRILNGDPNYTDSWHDIGGYAKLVEDRLNGIVQ